MDQGFKKFARDQRGLSTTEYAVLFVIIVVGALSVWSTLSDRQQAQIHAGAKHLDDDDTQAEGSAKP